MASGTKLIRERNGYARRASIAIQGVVDCEDDPQGHSDTQLRRSGNDGRHGSHRHVAASLTRPSTLLESAPVRRTRTSRLTALIRGERHVVSTSSVLILSQVLMAVAGVIAARQLGPSGRGVVTAVLAWAQIIPLFAVGGLNIAFLVRIAEERTHDARSALGNAAAYAGVVGTVVTPAAVLIVPAAVGGLSSDAEALSIVALTVIPFAVLNEMLIAINVGLGRIRHYNLTRILSPALIFIGTLALAAGDAITPMSVVVLTVGAGIATTAIAAWGLPWRQLRLDLRELKDDAIFGIKVALAGWVGFVNARLDVLVMSTFIAASQIGFYGVANNAMMPVTAIAASASGLLTPIVARTSDPKEQAALTLAHLRRYGAIAAAGGAALALAAPFAIPLLFGRAFEPAVAIIWILIPGYVARAWAGLTTAGAVGMRIPRIGNLAEIAALVVTAAALPILLPRYDAMGAAIASTAAYITSAVVAIALFRRHSAAANHQPREALSGLRGYD